MLGGVFGLYLLFMSLSGVSLVFKDEVVGIIQQKKATEMGNSPSIDLDRLCQSAQATASTSIPHNQVKFIENIDGSQGNLIYIHISGENGSRALGLERSTGNFIEEKREPWLVEKIGDLHHDLALGKPGKQYQGYLALAVQLLLASGLALTLLPQYSLRKEFHISRLKLLPKNKLLLHKYLALLATLPILLFTISALNFAFPIEFRKFWASNYQFNRKGSFSNLDTLRQKAEQSLKDSEQRKKFALREISFPKKHIPAYRFFFYDKLNVPLEVWVFPQQVKLIGSDFTDIDTVTAWLTRLHFGRALGTPGKFIWLCIGLLPAATFLSGLALKRWKAKLIVSEK
ncbi:MAG: PepSY domain-containing protein [Candidatus Obscuribacterales bacterium]|nr:PepSY domain-containing protein [Candidatus Obscuribacterales bacterium]